MTATLTSTDPAEDVCPKCGIKIAAALPHLQAQEGSRWANEILVADMLDKLMDEFATNQTAESEIRQLLWNNKVGFIRLAQSLKPRILIAENCQPEAKP